MKYICSYKLFESNQFIIDEIKDILLDVSDMGLTINITEPVKYDDGGQTQDCDIYIDIFNGIPDEDIMDNFVADTKFSINKEMMFAFKRMGEYIFENTDYTEDDIKVLIVNEDSVDWYDWSEFLLEKPEEEYSVFGGLDELSGIETIGFAIGG